jgi:DNA primase
VSIGGGIETELRFGGQSLRGRCPIHGGENRSAFAVFPDTQRWRCFRCDEGGDVLDLCQAVENHIEKWTAMLSLAQQFNVDLPQRPPKWCDRQNEKAEVRRMMRDALTKTYQRRLFRLVGDAAIDGIEDEVEQEEEARKLFEALRPTAKYLATLRMEGRHA